MRGGKTVWRGEKGIGTFYVFDIDIDPEIGEVPADIKEKLTV